jgi:hypothetical protein
MPKTVNSKLVVIIRAYPIASCESIYKIKDTEPKTMAARFLHNATFPRFGKELKDARSLHSNTYEFANSFSGELG